MTTTPTSIALILLRIFAHFDADCFARNVLSCTDDARVHNCLLMRSQVGKQTLYVVQELIDRASCTWAASSLYALMVPWRYTVLLFL